MDAVHHVDARTADLSLTHASPPLPLSVEFAKNHPMIPVALVTIYMVSASRAAPPPCMRLSLGSLTRF